MKCISVCVVIMLRSIVTKGFSIQPQLASVLQQQTPTGAFGFMAGTSSTMLTPLSTMRLFASINFPGDYDARAEAFGFSSPDDVAQAMKGSDLMILDVRTQAEIDSQGEIDSPDAKRVYSNCSPDQCPELATNASDLLPDKSATIVIHCASGKRAATAQQTLEKQGYKNVFNAGGLQDLKAILGQ